MFNKTAIRSKFLDCPPTINFNVDENEKHGIGMIVDDKNRGTICGRGGWVINENLDIVSMSIYAESNNRTVIDDFDVLENGFIPQFNSNVNDIRFMKYYDSYNVRVCYMNGEMIYLSKCRIGLENSKFRDVKIHPILTEVMPKKEELFDTSKSNSTSIYHFLVIHPIFSYSCKQDYTPRAICYLEEFSNALDLEDSSRGKYKVDKSIFMTHQEAKNHLKNGFVDEGGAIVVFGNFYPKLFVSNKLESRRVIIGWKDVVNFADILINLMSTYGTAPTFPFPLLDEKRNVQETRSMETMLWSCYYIIKKCSANEFVCSPDVINNFLNNYTKIHDFYTDLIYNFYRYDNLPPAIKEIYKNSYVRHNLHFSFSTKIEFYHDDTPRRLKGVNLLDKKFNKNLTKEQIKSKVKNIINVDSSFDILYKMVGSVVRFNESMNKHSKKV
jgi:hypothetical protein